MVAGWLAGWLAAVSLPGWVDCRWLSAGCLAGLAAGWTVDWLAGWLAS